MTDAGFFKGTSAEQDARFADKKKKLLKTMKFGDNLSQKVDMTRINLDCIRPWVIKRITELLNFEDEVVCDYVLNQLEERHPDPKEIQINITGFLNSKNARIFLTELWDLLLSAMETAEGIPPELLEAKKLEIIKREEDERRIKAELRRKEEELRQKLASTDGQRSPGHVRSNGRRGETDVDVRERKSDARDWRHSRSPSPRKRRSEDAHRDERRSSRYDSSKHRRRRRDRSRSSPPVSVDHDKDQPSETKQPMPDSVSSPEQPPSPKKVPAPDSDWRKDLMAGRRRSPPKMPENSYYGHHKERSRSIERRRDTRHASKSPRRSPLREPPRRHRPHRSPSHDYSDEDRYHKRNRRRYRTPSPSPARYSPVEERSAADRANKCHNRRAQWAQEEEELAVESELERQTAKKSRTSTDGTRKRARSLTPEGPALPPSQHKNKAAKSSSLESRSEHESGSSTDEDSSSGSSSTSSESSSDEDDTHPTPARSPEGPALPPVVKSPEGPALPHTKRTPKPSRSPSGVSESSSSSGSGDESESSESDASSSDSDYNKSSSKHPRAPEHRLARSTKDLDRSRGSKKRSRSPEASEFPTRKTSSSRDKRQRSPEKRTRRERSSDESAEEALRRRALASLLRASGEKRRRKSSS